MADTELTLAEGLSREYLLHHRMCPKGHTEDGNLIVAVGPEALADGLEDIAFVYRCPVQTVDAELEEVERLIERLTTRSSSQIELEPVDTHDDDFTTDVRGLANQPPVVRYVNLVVREAYDAGASDIHMEAQRRGLSVRFRVDGVLAPAPEPPSGLEDAVISRVKLLAEMDIAERRRPQDGRIRVRLESRELDLRVSTVPAMHGESVVLRLLDRGGRPVELEELGMNGATFAAMTKLADKPNGMILVTGPTGSGKTTTLYSALLRRDAAAEKIITVEDPIEYQLPGITQMPVHRQAGVTFGAALRSILRQDPDVIMVGETRDAETAEIAIQAAMTGHLVFSTLHTNDAVSVVPRLLDLGIPDYLVSATVEAVLAQRLVRKICDSCRTRYRPAPEVIATVTGRPVGAETLERGAGCSACRGTGFAGRLGLFELFEMTDEVREAIGRGASRAKLKALATANGMTSLKEDGWSKVEAGLTTVEEVLRVVQG